MDDKPYPPNHPDKRWRLKTQYWGQDPENPSRCIRLDKDNEEPLPLDYKPQESVRDFHKAFGCVANEKPTDLSAATRLLRARLVSEEAAEFVAACSTNDMIDIADSIADLLYVTYGAAVAFGLDAQELFKEVHRSNMTKTASRDSGGKVMKGPGYKPPNLGKIIWPDELFDRN